MAKKTGWQWKLLTFRTASFIYYNIVQYTQRPPQSRPHCTRLYSYTTTTSLLWSEYERVASRRTVDDLRSRSEPEQFLKTFPTAVRLTRQQQSARTETHTHTHNSCVFLYIYDTILVIHLQLSFDTDLRASDRYLYIIIIVVGWRRTKD